MTKLPPAYHCCNYTQKRISAIKLSDAIKNINRTPRNRHHYNIDAICNEVGIHGEIDSDTCEQRITSYYLASWYSDDSTVGVSAFFMDDQFIAIYTLPDSGCWGEWEWVDNAAYVCVRDFLHGLVKSRNEPVHITPLDMDMDFGDYYAVSSTSESRDFDGARFMDSAFVVVEYFNHDYTFTADEWRYIKAHYSREDGWYPGSYPPSYVRILLEGASDPIIAEVERIHLPIHVTAPEATYE